MASFYTHSNVLKGLLVPFNSCRVIIEDTSRHGKLGHEYLLPDWNSLRICSLAFIGRFGRRRQLFSHAKGCGTEEKVKQSSCRQ